MNMQVFHEIGLTDGEAKAYLALLRLGETKTGPLAKEAHVSLSKIYRILDKLMEKGLAGYVVKGKVRHYTAMDPKRLMDYLEVRKQELEQKTVLVKNMIPGLEMEKLHAPNKPQATLYEGFKAVTNFLRTMLDELNRGEMYYVIGAYYGSIQEGGKNEIEVPGLRTFFESHHRRRVAKGIHVKMLANHDIKGKMLPGTGINSEVRYLPQYLLTKMIIYFYCEKTFIVIFNQSPVGFLIEGKETVNSFEKYFNAFWKVAKK